MKADGGGRKSANRLTSHTRIEEIADEGAAARIITLLRDED